MRYIVYALIDTGNDELFYIGMSQRPGGRLTQHRQYAKHQLWSVSPKDIRIRAILNAGNDIEMVYIEGCDTAEQCAEREQFWISCYSALGYRLVNAQRDKSAFDENPAEMIAAFPPVPMLSIWELKSMATFLNGNVLGSMPLYIENNLVKKQIIRILKPERGNWKNYQLTSYGVEVFQRYLGYEYFLNCD